MSVIYVQTDSLAACGVIGACSGRTPAGDADAIEATDGGTAGTTELAVNINPLATEACFMAEIPVQDTDSLDAGTLTMRINITTAQASLTWEEVYVCRIDSGCTSQETLGSVTGMGVDVAAGGVFSQNVTLSAASAHNAGDKVYIIVVVANAHEHTTRSLAITPDQNIDTPFVAGSTTESITGTSAGTSADTAAVQAGASVSGTSAGTSSDTAPVVATASIAGTGAGTSSDSGQAGTIVPAEYVRPPFPMLGRSTAGVGNTP